MQPVERTCESSSKDRLTGLNLSAENNSLLWITGWMGLTAAILTGAGEFLLHFDPQARFTDGLAFFEGISESRSTTGHFLSVVGAPLYAVGAFHIFLMLKSSSVRWALLLFMLMAYGCAVGGVWIGSRASISAIVNSPNYADLSHLVELYDLRYESLLQLTRFVILAISLIYVVLVAKGGSLYPRWMAVANPIVLILLSFVVYLVVPDIGKYLMPIALNVGFTIFFCLSLYFVRQHRLADQEG